MDGSGSHDDFSMAALEAHLLGRIGFERCLALQQKLVDQIAARRDGQIQVLLCEHPDLITIGRSGSAADLHADSHLLTSRQIEVRWVKRGGGAMFHTQGQLAIYPIVPLGWHRFSVGEFMIRFQAGLLETLCALGVRPTTTTDHYGIYGRTGQLAAFGVAVRDGVTYHGAFLNVCPSMGLFRVVETDPRGHIPMSCLVAERTGRVKMTEVRAELIRQLTSAFGCNRCHIYSSHPLLGPLQATLSREA
jgi:lipoate-protein ligase B